jgi:hypothetical protein
MIRTTQKWSASFRAMRLAKVKLIERNPAKRLVLFPLSLPPLLFRRLPRRVAFVSSGLLFGQDDGLALDSLGFGPCPRFRGIPFSLCGELCCADRLLGQFGFMRSLRGFPLCGASSAFCQHGFSCPATLCDRRIIRPGRSAELLQYRLFCRCSGILALPKIRQHVPFHHVSFSS